MTSGTVRNEENPCHIPGIDTPGDDIRVVNNLRTFEECAAECSAEKRFVTCILLKVRCMPKFDNLHVYILIKFLKKTHNLKSVLPIIHRKGAI